MVQSTHNLVIGEHEVVKTYVDWARGEPDREWQALTLLHEFAPGLSPRPVRRGTADGKPFVVMDRLPGRPLGEQPLTPAQVAGLGTVMSRMYRCLPPEAWPGVPVRTSGADHMVSRVRDWMAEPRGPISPQVDRALSLGSTWLAGRESSTVAEAPAERVFTLGDGNLGNVLWDGTRCRLVDFEDAGSSDIAYEVADLVEHVSVWLDGLVSAEILAPYLMLSANEQRRLLMCRRLFRVYWLLMLLPGNRAHDRNPRGTVELQARRVVELLSGEGQVD